MNVCKFLANIEKVHLAFGISIAIVVGGMGREGNLIIDERLTDFTPKINIKGELNNEFVRSLTPREWARMQGFPDTFAIPVSDTQAYNNLGILLQ